MATFQPLLKDNSGNHIDRALFPQPGDAIHNEQVDAEKVLHESAMDADHSSDQALARHSFGWCCLVDAVKFRACLSRHRSFQSIALFRRLHWFHPGGRSKDLHRTKPDLHNHIGADCR